MFLNDRFVFVPQTVVCDREVHRSWYVLDALAQQESITTPMSSGVTVSTTEMVAVLDAKDDDDDEEDVDVVDSADDVDMVVVVEVVVGGHSSCVTQRCACTSYTGALLSHQQPL